MSVIDKYIQDNEPILRTALNEADGRQVDEYGFGCNTNRSLFEQVLEEKEYYYLPLCLLTLYFGVGVPRNRDFALTSLKHLHAAESDFHQLTSYVYSFCLHDSEDDDKSLQILHMLAEAEYAPALCTLGDLQLRHGNYEEAIKLYDQAISLGHVVIRGWRLRVIYSQRGRGGMVMRCIRSVPLLFPILRQMHSNKNTGKNCMYLDFYDAEKALSEKLE